MKRTKMKPVVAWAIVERDGDPRMDRLTGWPGLYLTRETARALSFPGDRIVRVRITEVRP